MKVLEVEGLEKRYRRFHLNVSFSMEVGETLAFIGPNGAGKTTLMYTLLNIVRRDGGRVRFFGLDLDRHEVEIKRRVGFLFEEPRLFKTLRVRHLLEVFKTFYPSWDQSYALRLLGECGLDPEKRFHKLSKGMRTQVAVIIALAPRPRLLIFDEPTAGLDPKMRRWLKEKIREAREEFGPALLLTSHIMRDVEDLADRIAFLDNGRIALLRHREELAKWRIIEGTCDGSLTVGAVKFRFVREGETHRFRLLVERDDDRLREDLRRCGAKITNVFAPDLEELYDWIIETRAE
ncbi:ABC transporter ATP-binding protein YtrB [bacterium HR10]|nr:ABC transporter ATP-binding protein YtrB [bacterium HR10]